jgi:apolipoprotein N-acyltransferase
VNTLAHQAHALRTAKLGRAGRPARTGDAKVFAMRLTAAVSSAVLVVLATAELDIWALAWVALVPLLVTIERSTTQRAAFMLGWVMGFATNLGGFYWTVDLLERFGPLPTPWALFGCASLCAYQGLVFALFSWLTRVLRQNLRLAGKSLPLSLVAPVVMVACELVLPLVFPWNLGMTQAWVVPVIQVAELSGPYGVTALLLLVNGALCDVWLQGKRGLPSAASAFLLLGAALVFGSLRIAQIEALELAAPKIALGVVQANIPFSESASQTGVAARRLTMLQQQSRQLAERGAELILWTETAYPYVLPQSLEHDYAEREAARIRRGFAVPLLFGASALDTRASSPSDGPRYTNSAFYLEASGRVQGRYDKNQLLTFGENVPFDDTFPWLRRLRLASAGSFRPGSEVSAFSLARGAESFRVAPMICFEDLLPEHARRLGALHPHLLVDLSNDAWFGPTREPYQHLAVSVFRSVEQRIPMVRAVNGGASALISATGEVRQHTPRATTLHDDRPPERFEGSLALLEGGHTFFATHGNAFARACLALLLLGLAIAHSQALRARRLASAGASRAAPHVTEWSTNAARENAHE